MLRKNVFMFLVFLWISTTILAAAQPTKVIVDVDLDTVGDDAMALLALIQSEKVNVLGVTTVTGNVWGEQATANTRRLLEAIGRAEIATYAGANYPLVNTPEELQRREKRYGSTSDGGYKGAWEEIENPPKRKVHQSLPAPRFLVETIKEHPNEVVLIAVGPLTNISLALSEAPEISSLVKEIIIMGGGIDTPPEFNFWLDPEAAHQVLRATWPQVVLTPLNICQQAPLTPKVIRELVEGDSPIARYFEQHLGGESAPKGPSLMYDQVAVISFLEPSVVRRSELMWLDVEVDHGPDYGATRHWRSGEQPPEGVRKVKVQLDLDYPRFVEEFVALMRR
jgi:inosine-uridine nucleoside N-ribohydrolase